MYVIYTQYRLQFKMSQRVNLSIEKSGRGKEQLANQKTEEEEKKRLLVGIMEGDNDSVLPPLSYFSPNTEKGSISRTRLKMSEASWIERVLKERKKRNQMNEKFSVLRSMVPSLSNNASKHHKEKVISETLDYIKYLQKETERLEGLTKFKWKEQNEEKPILSKCKNENSSVQVTVSNGVSFIAIQLPFRRGSVFDIVKVLEKHDAEVLEARFSVDDQQLLTFTTTVRVESDGGNTIDQIRQELLTL